jgi:hypothetical protein
MADKRKNRETIILALAKIGGDVLLKFGSKCFRAPKHEVLEAIARRRSGCVFQQCWPK